MLFEKSKEQKILAAYKRLKAIKEEKSALEAEEKSLKESLRPYMTKNKDGGFELTVNGRVLATISVTEASKSFDLEAFKKAMPEEFSKFLLKEKAGYEKFFLK